MRLLLALALVVLTWDLVGLVAAVGSGDLSLPASPAKYRDGDEATASVDFAQFMRSRRSFLVPSAPAAIVLTSTGALALVLLVVVQLRRQGSLLRP